MPREAFKPVFVMRHMLPQHQRKTTCLYNRPEKRMRPRLMAHDSFELFRFEYSTERAPSSQDGVWPTQAGFTEHHRVNAGLSELARDPPVEAQRDVHFHGRREMPKAREGPEECLYATVKVAAVHVQNSHVQRPSYSGTSVSASRRRENSRIAASRPAAPSSARREGFALNSVSRSASSWTLPGRWNTAPA